MNSVQNLIGAGFAIESKIGARRERACACLKKAMGQQLNLGSLRPDILGPWKISPSDLSLNYSLRSKL